MMGCVLAAAAFMVQAPPVPPVSPPASLPPALKKTINTVRPAPQFDGWATPVRVETDAPPPRAVVYRWWTTSCPWCRRSLPALEQLRMDYAARGVQVVAVFHPKGLTRLTPEAVAVEAKALGFHGAVAIDTDWSELGRLAGPPGNLSATSVTLVLDQARRMVHAHRGPAFCPSADLALARENAGYVALQQALERLASPKQPPRPAVPAAE